MTTAPTRPSGSSASAITAGQSSHAFTGTLQLLRVMIRRDQIRTPAWIIGVAVLNMYFANAIKVIAEDTTELISLTVMFADPVGRMMTGPGYGIDAPTHERFYSAGYVLFVLILVALMAIFTVTRHTRADEQAGRSELLRSNVLGRHAPLTAALILTVCATTLTSILIYTGAVAAGYATTGSLLIAAGAAATGWFFAGFSTTTAQLTTSSRSANAIAGAVLATAYLIRMGGDMGATGGTALSWGSPLAWAQQTAPYVLDRAWPLTLLLVGGAVFIAVGYALSTRRDLNAGLLPGRLGRAHAHPTLGTPLGFAFRTQRGTLRGWGIALILTSLMYGGFANAMVTAADDLPDEFAVIFTGDDLLNGYFAYMALFMAVFTTAAAISALTHTRAEEASGRTELILSTPTHRTTYLISAITITVAATILILILVSLAMAATSAATLTTPPTGLIGTLVTASIHQLPAALALIGLTTMFLGWFPRAASPVAWTVIGYSVALSSFGQLLNLPTWARNINPFHHLADYPVEPVNWTPIMWLTALGIAGILVGLVGWNRRELGRI